MTSALVVVGAGGLGREVVAAVRAGAGDWHLAGFVDDVVPAGTEVYGLPVLGPLSDIGRWPDASVVVCVASPGRNRARRDVVHRLALPPERYASVVHPAAVLPLGSTVGAGSVVLAGVIATTPVDIGRHVIMMPATVLTHDDEIEDFSTIAAGVRLAGGVTVSEGAYVGSGALVREHVTIGPWSLVGMGSVVLEDVPAMEVWVGAPARRLRSLDGAAGAG